MDILLELPHFTYMRRNSMRDGSAFKSNGEKIRSIPMLTGAVEREALGSDLILGPSASYRIELVMPATVFLPLSYPFGAWI